MITITPMEKCIVSILHESDHLDLGSFVKSMSWYANVLCSLQTKIGMNTHEARVVIGFRLQYD